MAPFILPGMGVLFATRLDADFAPRSERRVREVMISDSLCRGSYGRVERFGNSCIIAWHALGIFVLHLFHGGFRGLERVTAPLSLLRPNSSVDHSGSVAIVL